MGSIIDGTKIAKIIKEDIKTEIQKLEYKPTLAVVLIGDNTASSIYIKHKKIACEYVGINFILHNLDEITTTNELLSLINTLNNDKNITSILVQLPLPAHINERQVLLSINPLKDVDGFHPYNIGLLSADKRALSPCTPSGCIELLKRYDVDITGKHCVIIGRSNIVGKPLSMMLLNENATISMLHSKTKDIQTYTKMADIIVVATGVMGFLKPDMIKDGVILIDVGIHRVDKKLYGDIHLDCAEKSSLYTPVPGGVGPMTIAMLMKNCLLAYYEQNGLENKEEKIEK